MQQVSHLDSTTLHLPRQLKGCMARSDWTLLFPLKTAGVAQLVEHHLAKVDVASSSLVTRSSLRLNGLKCEGWSECPVALGKADRPNVEATADSQPSDALSLLAKVGIASKKSSTGSFFRSMMFLWRKSAERGWVEAHREILQAAAQGALVIVKRPGHKRFQLEIACNARGGSRALLEQFGGRVEELPRNWLERFAGARTSKPIKIGKRLIVAKPVNERRGCRWPLSSAESGSPRQTGCAEDSARSSPDRRNTVPLHSRFYGLRNRRACYNHDGASPFGRTDAALEARLVACRSWHRQRNSSSGCEMFRRRTRRRH